MSLGLWCATCNIRTDIDIMDDVNAVLLLKSNMCKILSNLRVKYPWNTELINLAQRQADQYISQISMYKTKEERILYATWIGNTIISLLQTTAY